MLKDTKVRLLGRIVIGIADLSLVYHPPRPLPAANASLLQRPQQMIHQPDFIVPVEIENQVHNVYVIKRPGVDRTSMLDS